jgi:LGFP repeat-containing protein
MSTLLLDYKLDSATVSNPDGSFELAFSDVSVVPGPGVTVAGNFPDALDLGSTGKGAIDVSALEIDQRQFTLRVVFQANGPITARTNLIESNRLPFSLFLLPRNSTEFNLVASVSPVVHGWRGASTTFTAGLRPGIWYVADLVYDIDTVALFVNEGIVSVHAFWWGEIEQFPGHDFFIGTWVDGARNHFDGKLAAVQWWAGIPDTLQAQVDERRSHPEWFITHKLESLRSRLDLGEPLSRISYLGGNSAYLQHYQNGALMYNDSVGTAFEMHGAIYARFLSMGITAPLGYLVSDESPSTDSVGRKSVFSKGAIYWSPKTGAVPVVGQLYIDYEALGEARTLGFPTRPALSISGGLEQEFLRARMFYKTGQPNAHEVHGAILAKFLSTGGIGAWGFPIGNETDVRRGATVVGKFSEFERCTIYWSSTTDAFEVHGDIRRKFRDLKGPIGELGFPTSDEQDIPGVAGGRFNTFQNGTLLWYGDFASMIFARPFRIYIGRINSKESEGWLRGENDMYIYIKVWDGPQLVYDQRRPSSGDWGGNNIVDVDFTIPVVITPNALKTVRFSIDVWEADSFDDDDHLGTWTKVLDPGNGWGLRENGGILNSGSFSDINSITAAVHPIVDVASLTTVEKFWGVRNRGTDDISYQQYAAAFSDVDSDTEWWDITDWLDKAFYELVVEDLAENGNCFGMSLEAIYSLKGRSLFSMPLNRFTEPSWNVVGPEVNVRHCYQVGAGPIWWFVGEFLSGNTHDPVDVFNSTRAEFNRGNNPVICIAQNYDFSGAPHCILPVAWDSSSKPWRITICDPNFPNELKTLTVDPDDNEFGYVGKSTYRGSEWTGGRFHYMPYSLVSSAPRTPVWDAILLILAGTLIILGDDAQTQSLTDGDGRDLDGHGNRARELLQSGDTLNGFFVPMKGYDRAKVPVGRQTRSRTVRRRGKGTIAGEILMRRHIDSDEQIVGPAGVDLSQLSHLPLEALTASRSFRAIHNALFDERRPSGRDASRTLYHLAQDSKAMRKLAPEVRKLVSTAAQSAVPGDFRHSVVGLRRGAFAYGIKQGLSEFRLDSSLTISEKLDLAIDRLGTSTNSVEVKASRDKVMRLEIANKLGVAGDNVRITIDQIAFSNAAPLQLNIKPGIGGLEVMTGGERVNARLQVKALIDKKEIRRSFRLPLEGGMRLKLSNVLSQRTLGVSRIDKLLAPGKDVKIITSSI